MKQTPIQTAEKELVMRQTAAKHLPVGSIVARQNQTAIDRLYDTLTDLHIQQIEARAL